MSENSINPEEKSPRDDENSADKPNPEDFSESKPEENLQTQSSDSVDNPEKNKISDITVPVRELQKPKTSNYQISLVDENLLKVSINTKQAVKIISSVKEINTSAETQSNEIYLYPKFNQNEQEITVLIAIDEPVKQTDENIGKERIEETKPGRSGKSNFQINLINENLLNVKIETEKGVRIDSYSKERFSVKESQANKIFIHPKSGKEIQIVEIVIELEPVSPEKIRSEEEGEFRFIPNPEVVDLITPPTYPGEGSIDEFEEVSAGYKNPFDALRKLIRRNMTIGIISAVALHSVAAGIVYFNVAKKSKIQKPEELPRLIVIQDLPDPKINIQNVEDPNKPPEIPLPEDTEKKEEIIRDIKPRKTVRPPEVKRPEREDVNTMKDTSGSSDLTKELDSLRRLVESIDTLAVDTTSADSLAFAYQIPDSLRNDFNESDIGLALYFPKSWKLTDQREINKSETEFKGILLTDTTAEQPGTMTMFIYLDNENKEFNQEDFKTEFPVFDSTITVFSKEPKTIAGFTEYKFYVFNKLGTEKLSIGASVRKQYFDQYKKEIESVVRSIKIKRMENVNDSTKAGTN